MTTSAVSQPKRPLQTPASPSSAAKRTRVDKGSNVATGFDDDDADAAFGDDDGGVDDAALAAATQAVEDKVFSSPPAPAPPSSSSSTRQRPPRASTPASPTRNLAAAAAAAAATTADELALERETMDAKWFARLEPEMHKPYFKQLKHFLAHEAKAGVRVFPPQHLVHSWSRLTPLSSVKVVVVGQDPYHGPGQACGMSFSVPKGVAVPASLRNIYKELTDEFPAHFKAPNHGNLESWATQGVLLLNACLTVRSGQAASHHGKGWEPFTRSILKLVAEQAAAAGSIRAKGGKTATATSAVTTKPERGQTSLMSAFKKVQKAGKEERTGSQESDSTKTEKAASLGSDATKEEKAASQGNDATKEEKAASQGNDTKKAEKTASPQGNPSSRGCRGVVFLAWGQPAAKTLAEAGITEKTPNVLLLRSPHPSPLSAHRGFLGNGHFKRANAWLEDEARYGPGGGIKWGDL